MSILLHFLVMSIFVIQSFGFSQSIKITVHLEWERNGIKKRSLKDSPSIPLCESSVGMNGMASMECVFHSIS